MSKLNRRTFLTLASLGSTAAVAAALPGSGALRGATETSNIYTFRAVTGMPAEPLPSYASYVVEGHIDLARQSGIVTQAVFAGVPEAMSGIALPGLSRVVRVTGVQRSGTMLSIRGIIDDRSQLQAGERAAVDIRINQASGVVTSRFYGGDKVELSMA